MRSLGRLATKLLEAPVLDILGQVQEMLQDAQFDERGGTGTAVNTGDVITAAKMNLKLEDIRDMTAFGLLDQSGAGAQELLLSVTENLSADRTLTITVNDADRTIDIAGNLTLAGAFTTAGAFGVTLTATALTSVTLPTTGTLATLAGAENLTTKTITAAALSGTFTGTPTFSGATITFTGGTIAFTAAADFTIGTTDANDVIIQANGADRFAVQDTIGRLTVYQTTGNYTIIFSDPAASRNITFPDPGGADSVVYLAATQSLSNKTVTGGTFAGTIAGTPTFSGATITFTGGLINLTAGAAFTVGTTDANDLIFKANNANRFAVDDTIGQLIVYQTTGNYTLAFADPAAGRTITIADPGGAATLAYINQVQTISAAHIFSGTPVFRSTVAATNAIEVENTNDAASVLVAIFEGDRATPGDNDAAYISFRLSDSAGNQDEGVRLTWQATTVLSGATQDTDLILSALANNTMTEHLRLDGSANQMQASRPVYITVAANGLQVENTNDGASSQVAIFEGNRATPGDNDAAYITLRLSDSAGTQDEGARITWQATTVLSGATQDTDLILSALVNNSLTTFVTLDGSASEVVSAVNLRLNSAGSLILPQAAGDYTITWADPGAGRALTLADPGGADTFVFAAMTQTLSGKTISMSGNLTFASALDIVIQAATAVALELSDGATKLWAVDSRVAVDNVEVHTWTAPAPTFASAAGSTWIHHQFGAVSVTLTGGTGVTAMNGLQAYFDTPTITSAAATTVGIASTVYIRPPVAAGGGPAAITNNYIINTSVAGCFLTAAGVWTDASSAVHKTDIMPVDLNRVPELLEELEIVSYRRIDPSDGGFERFGVIAEEAPSFLATSDRQGVSSGYMAGFSLAAVKWLQKENAELKDRVTKLEAMLSSKN